MKGASENPTQSHFLSYFWIEHALSIIATAFILSKYSIMTTKKQNRKTSYTLSLALLALFCHGLAASMEALTLEMVSFRAGYAVLDDGGNTVSVPSWAPTTNWPVLCVRSNPVSAGSAYGARPPYNGPDYQEQCVGFGPDGLYFTGTVQNVSSSPNSTPFSFDFSSTNNLTNFVTKYTPFRVQWKSRTRADENSPWSAYSATFGTSTNELFVCLADPLDSRLLYRSVVSNACHNIGAATQNDAVLGVWSTFSSASGVKNWRGQPLYYYEPGYGHLFNPDPLWALFYYNRGSCFAWREFLLQCLQVHGITAQINQVGCNFYGEQHFIIKNMSFNTPSLTNLPYGWRMYFAATNQPSMLPIYSNGVYGDVSQLTGIAGQGSATPSEKVFKTHAVLLYNGTYYDPSYKVKYTGPYNMETNVVCGFSINATNCVLTNGNWGYRIDARQSYSNGLQFVPNL
jgi:hypothetical protein